LLINKRYFLSARKQIQSIEEILEWTEHDAVIEVVAVGVCSSDCQNYLDNNTNYFGHEIAGEVLTAGEGFNEHERVVVLHKCGCFKCDYCQTGISNLCNEPYQVKVGFAKYLTLPKAKLNDCVYKIPAAVPISEAAFVDSVAAAVHALNMIELQMEDSNILLLGNGFMAIIFSYLIQKMRKHSRIYGRNPQKNKFIQNLGLGNLILEQPHVINESFDVCVDTTGDAATIYLGMAMLKRKGRILCFSRFKNPAHLDLNKIRDKEIAIVFSKFHNPQDIEAAIQLLQDRTIPMAKLIMDSFVIITRINRL
jgi:L-iditol 2-dehydrogenase